MSTRNLSSATWASVMRNTVLRFFTPAFRHRLARSTCKIIKVRGSSEEIGNSLFRSESIFLSTALGKKSSKTMGGREECCFSVRYREMGHISGHLFKGGE